MSMLVTTNRHVSDAKAIAAAAPLMILPLAVAWAMADGPPWVFMWVLAFSIYAGCKWLTLFSLLRRESVTIWNALAYLLLWPGMNAETFVRSARPVAPPAVSEWLAALTKSALGLLLIYAVAPRWLATHPLTAGWIGMTGLILALHFGVFHLVSLIWRRAGYAAPPIMRSPLMATSVADFWGRRWNLAFHELAMRYFFQPTIRTVGATLAMMWVFVASGLVHDLIITVPVRGGYGGPTLYFMLQGVALLIERSTWGRRWHLNRGWTGRVFCLATLLTPVGLLFPAPFVERAILPTLHAIGAF